MKVLFIDGTEGFYPQRIEERPAGGIVTSLTLIPRLLAERYGHDCIVASLYDQEVTYQGVRYIQIQNGLVPVDLVVYNRNMLNNVYFDTMEVPSIWWLHDIPQFTYLSDDSFRRVDKIVALSDYCLESYADFYEVPRSKFIIIPNGVDKKVFHTSDHGRNSSLYVMASAPVKGLEPVKFIYSQMKRHNADFQLRLYSSMSLHDQENTETMNDVLSDFTEVGIEIMEPVKQHDLADVFRDAYALLMPNSYPEMCSNILLQARACGLPVIASAIGSVPEFIVHEKTGLLTRTAPHDLFWFWKDIAKESVRLWKDRELHEFITRHAPIGVLDWVNVADRWNHMIMELVREKAA